MVIFKKLIKVVAPSVAFQDDRKNFPGRGGGPIASVWRR
jgi:hypothetical protein